MVSGLQFVESILFWIGIALLFSAFVSACMESRHSGEADQARVWLGSRFEYICRVPMVEILVTTLRVLRNGIDHIVSGLMTNFDTSSLSAPVVMAVLSILLPVAAAMNALLGGASFLAIMYLCVAASFLILGIGQSTRKSSFILGLISFSATFSILVFGPFYAAESLTDHILQGTFSHSVLGSIFVAVILYAGCAGAWFLYRSIRNVGVLSGLDRAIARFLFAVPCMYILYWFGLLAGHFAINDPSPTRVWIELLSVVVVGAITFSAVLCTIEFGVMEKRRGHGLAVIFASGIVSLTGVVAINGLVTQHLPFWLRFWQHDFTASDIILGSTFWTSHSPLFLWAAMILSVLFIAVARGVVTIWSKGSARQIERPFVALSAVCVIGAVFVFAGRSLIDVYVNVNIN